MRKRGVQTGLSSLAVTSLAPWTNSGTLWKPASLMAHSPERTSRGGSSKGVGELGVLVVADVRVPVGRKTDAMLYRVRDTGIRCVRAPCFFMRAWRLSTSYVVTVSELGLDSARLTSEELRRAEAALQTKNGLFLAGRIERAADGGRRLSVLRVYLRP